jgi:hypothetical protein
MLESVSSFGVEPENSGFAGSATRKSWVPGIHAENW